MLCQTRRSCASRASRHPRLPWQMHGVQSFVLGLAAASPCGNVMRMISMACCHLCVVLSCVACCRAPLVVQVILGCACVWAAAGVSDTCGLQRTLALSPCLLVPASPRPWCWSRVSCGGCPDFQLLKGAQELLRRGHVNGRVGWKAGVLGLSGRGSVISLPNPYVEKSRAISNALVTRERGVGLGKSGRGDPAQNRMMYVLWIVMGMVSVAVVAVPLAQVAAS